MKKTNYYQLLLLTIAVFAYLETNGQDLLWQNTIGGDQYDLLNSIHPTSDGGYILGGQSNSNSSGDKKENSFGDFDYWIIKVNATGEIEWEKTIGGSDFDILNSVIQTSDGGYLCGGWSQSPISGNKTDPTNGDEDYWIVKLTSTGAIEWDQSIGGSLNDRLWEIQETSDGGYILGGNSTSDASADKSENAIGDSDYWVVKVNNVGNIEFENTIGGTDMESLISIDTTQDGGYILGGYSRSNISGDKTESGHGAHDYWIIKLDENGQIQWQNTIGGNDEDYLRSIRQTADEGYILGGTSLSGISGDKTEDSQGNSDYWVVKTDNAGAIEWQNTIGGTGIDGLEEVRQTANGDYILAGFSDSNASADKTEDSNGLLDYWVVRLDGSGSIVTQKTIGGSQNDGLQALALGANGIVVVGGFSDSNISGDKTENNIGLNDLWLVGLDVLLSNNSFSLSDQIKIFPNPTKDFLEISTQQPMNSVTVFQLNGRRLFDQEAEGFSHRVNVSQLAAGLYFIQINSEENTQTMRFLKQ